MSDQLTLDLAAVGPVATGPAPPPDQANRDRITDDTAATLFVEAGAGAGKTTALVSRIVRLVDEGVALDAVAAITFTEKAAAELRHRVRVALEEPALAPDDERARRASALEVIDRAPIGTVHAFARRLLFELPVEAGLPPGFSVLDELESHLELDERWEDLQDQLLDDAARQVGPGLSAAELVALLAWPPFGGLPGLRRIIEDFQANWDLVEARVDRDPPSRPDDSLVTVRAALTELVETPVPDGDRQRELLDDIAALLPALATGGDLGARLAALDVLTTRLGKVSRVGNQLNWKAHGGANALNALRTREAQAYDLLVEPIRQWREYRRLVVGALAGRFVLTGAMTRAAAGTLEFHDLLVLARHLLATHQGARRLLHHRYQRVLLDEFQDTDPIQLEIAIRLTAPPDAQAADASKLRPVPGRLFVVGDPKQSIYRFRRADIAVYLSTPDLIAADVERLTANFRSTAAVIDWVNGVFGQAIRPKARVQPEYRALSTCRPGSRQHGSVTVLGMEEHDTDLLADGLREAEATDVAAAVATALTEGWPVTDRETGALRPCRPGDITVLLPARTSLPMLQAALFDLDVPYRAENASVVYVAPEIRAMMLALRAAADPTDELALVETLRTPLYGCSDVDLYDWRQSGGQFRPFTATPSGMEGHPVAAAIDHVRSLARRVGRAGPAELLEAIVEERRVVETALAGPSARDVWRRVRYVVDQARAWTDAGGRGVRRYLRWVVFQGKEGRAGDSVLPERDHDAVRVMTVHAAKGLEFPITVLAGLTTRMPRRQSMSVVWPDGDWRLVDRHDEQFEDFKPLDEQMSDAERRRLLYVACTRAVDHLVVSLHRKPEKTDEGTGACTSATVLFAAGAAGHGATTRVLEPSAIPHPPAEELELPWADAGPWEAERVRAIIAGSVRSATSATRLAGGLGGGELALVVDDDPGLDKDPVDLDLPPWQRGRYGTAIGRAVHAVLQDADLAEGTDIPRLAAAQCAAEGIFAMQASVEALARSALAAPIVRAAAAGAEHWRELFVVASLGDTVLEGYIDLLVRTPDGLVVVDYKTDVWRTGTVATARIGRYRHQLAAYGLALSRLLDEPIAGGVLVHCRDDAPAVEIPIERWAEAIAAVAPVGVAAGVDYSG
ncbi:MAG: UvrD-helicase domain-containing protein [Acidimicrobiia bacterium]|nr:UvrD-helicase domain-containing protein [Acidimicrobiia bacterium]